ncbi:MAG: glycerol kinase GlpK [Alcanivorax sp.]|jgi:glycerol kinase
MSRYLLSLDQGTTSSRAILFDKQGNIVTSAQQEFDQHFPHSGWVEHVPEDIWQSTLHCAKAVLDQAAATAQDIISIGITNQRETTLIWDRATGEPVYPAIVWQDRRTADLCRQWQCHADEITAKTGLLLDPYFSASKICWILDNVDGCRQRAEQGELIFGTVDTWLIWNLTAGQNHVTDATNASRTMLFNIHEQCWDAELLNYFNIPPSLLPRVQDSASEFGQTDPEILGGAVDIGGVAGDQQAALIGQGCFQEGMVKSTYGTGCFVVLNTGSKALMSSHRLLTTVGYRINGEVTYALEGSIFMAGATIQWIRDGLQLIGDAKDSQLLAEQTGYDNPVYMVPAFAGLGAPYWDADARGAIFGLSRDTGIKEIVTAGLQAVCYQTRDLLEAMAGDGVDAGELRVDGGMVVNDWLVQFLADVLGITITRPKITETTALGAAYLAGLQAGVFDSLEEVAELWQEDRQFRPELPLERRQSLYAGWQEAIGRLCSR